MYAIMRKEVSYDEEEIPTLQSGVQAACVEARERCCKTEPQHTASKRAFLVKGQRLICASLSPTFSMCRIGPHCRD